ncbi:cGMP-dependent protein kinase 1 [Stomoxys calcitrans]|uniref:cGMP-dependent protein kinase 1 n=1 Tax=Stomoxys calcitrans TaxID=35570 RepID=UPI0027E24769|nr:cGMP-dependent protein kinase 1 [Stomoxys calcitrans]XP_013105255.2 cGMP-dependent protein kinase 1 [Stomoxys calcitrans]XP_013105256.2 cGMP-dependent protein kinase 1 [Stomoxys calcitrans]XP_013105257.2 cGMP-dependent protein kinase 1 [Stomoxys calcitrans]XP_013105258.2 cGMP-dependent protein kinase 1 [Stomoxys calcitrans]XP_013105259.2 cGMP-dependent protein kinase 1 [Stomoxys calcitrans]XP_013105260.2 cGMP-dependent protein kinase 1 [Stomoxys calcitrans]XP_013105261.2 cGMP-dependent pr
MACFNRFFPSRQKSSFTPEKDENKDTVLNTNDNTVQIGRYIRRDESSFFTPKSTESLRTPAQRQSILNHHTTANVAGNQTQTQAAIAAAAATTTTTNKVNSLNKSNKKFITSNKVRNANATTTPNGGYTVANGSIQAKQHLHQQHPQLPTKLKPVKERRPTALPLQQPKIENGHADDDDEGEENDFLSKDNGIEMEEQSAKFFIGNASGDDDDDDDDEDEDNADVVVVANEKLTVFVTPPSSARIQEVPFSYPKQQFANAVDVTGGKQTSLTSLSSFSAAAATATATSSAKIRTKLPSNTSNKLRKFGRTDTANSSLSQQQEEEEKVHIPPPPPLPPQPLCTPSLSVISRGKRISNMPETPTSATSATSSSTFPVLTETEVKETQASSPTPSLDSTTSTTTTTATTATHQSGNVPLRESTPSPKESDSSGETPKSHRAEGGLIFARTNLPFKKDVHIDYIEKDEKTRNLIRKAIEKNDFLNNYMDKERKEMVIDAMEMLHFKQNDFIINEDDEGSEIYVSEEGKFDVIKQDKVIGQFGGETVFGELAILYNAKRFASIRAVTNAKVWKIDRDKFRKIMVISGSKEREENLHFLRSAPFLNDLSEEVLSKVVDLLQRKFFATNTCIVREGDIGNEFFIIRGGTVTIKKLTDAGEERVVDNRKRGDYFGEQALLNADRRQASVYADAPGTEVLKLDREAFISYLGTIPQLRELPVERSDPEGRDSNRKSEFDNEYAKIQLTDLKKIATLGAGAFGKVDLVQYDANTIFALKIVKKIDIVKQDQIEHIYSEKHVMMKCRSSPFIIELFKTFRNEKFVYFLMEACMGGDVWTVMSQRRFFDEKTARFIAGCVVEAFDFLHSHNIIYRDLKPENLMLTTDGYCKLVDFGFAKHIPTNQKTHTFAGTPEYVAPEIILDRGHDRSVDYWALGILIFELLVGKTPFRGQNQIKIYQQILGGIDVVQMPSKIPKPAQNLIRSLCKQLPAERLGYQRKGILDIKKHSWFDGLDWQKLRNKQLSSPIKRPIHSKTDLQHFGPSGVENEVDPPPETSGWDIDF